MGFHTMTERFSSTAESPWLQISEFSPTLSSLDWPDQKKGTSILVGGNLVGLIQNCLAQVLELITGNFFLFQ